MTTAPPARTLKPSRASGVVLRTVGPVVVATGILAVVGASVVGSPAALGAAVGGGILVLVLGASTLMMDVVASLASGPVVLVGLVTYAFHIALVLVALIALNRSGLTDSTLDGRWVGGAVVLGAVVWSICQVVVTARTRIPIYDLPDQPVDSPDRPGA